MSIFGNIVNAIFGRGKSAAATAAPSAPGTSGSAGGSSAGSSATTSGGSGKPRPISRAELEAKIQEIANSTGRKDYNWKQSIVDLMKLLDLDSSLKARQELARELGYTGKTDGSAEMNIWLHKQVMERVMASGGTVPAELR